MVSGIIFNQYRELWVRKRHELYQEIIRNKQNEMVSAMHESDMDLPRALLKIPVGGDLAQEVKNELVYLKYCPKGVRITSISDLRWHMFCKQLVKSNKLSPILSALEEHIKLMCW